jgi:uncharacterized protein (AIM24 family)
MKSHVIDYEIIGDDLQVVEVELDPSETVIAEAGAMNWMDDQIAFEAKMGDGSKPDKGIFGKLLDAGKRIVNRRVSVPDTFYKYWQRKTSGSFCCTLSG